MQVNGKTVDTPSTLARVIAGFAPGAKVEVQLLRDGKKKPVVIDLTERKTETAATAKKPKKALGLTLESLTPDLRERYKLKEEDKGLVVTAVEPGSPGESQGLQEGDLIREVNKQAVEEVDAFVALLEKLDKKQSILLRVLREGRAFFVVIESREKPEK
jgi:serine protease Do